MSETRLNVFPSRMALQNMKAKLIGAKRGYELLKKKSDALKTKIRTITKKIFETKQSIGEDMKAATFSHTEATWAAGDFNNKVISSVESASLKVKVTIENIAGVKIPTFAPSKLDADDGIVGLSKGGRQITKCRDVFTKVLDKLIVLASLQTSLKLVDSALQVTNRRVNALNFVVIPKLENTVAYILSELDELEREEFYRLKMVKAFKVQEQEQADKQRESAYAIPMKSNKSVGAPPDENNLLVAVPDPDMIITNLADFQ